MVLSYDSITCLVATIIAAANLASMHSNPGQHYACLDDTNYTGPIIIYTCMHAGPCSRARVGGQDVDCDEDGNFEPLQCCRTDSRGVFQCACREPEGEVVPGTEVEVEDRDDVPDCDDEGKVILEPPSPTLSQRLCVAMTPWLTPLFK